MEVPAEGSAPTGVDMGIEPADCRGGGISKSSL